ncbi:MAG: hypothetical protein WC340_12505, partial [Kiritimatiellia bacterium]
QAIRQTQEPVARLKAAPHAITSPPKAEGRSKTAHWARLEAGWATDGTPVGSPQRCESQPHDISRMYPCESITARAQSGMP